MQNPTENVGWTMDTLTLVKNEIQLKSVSNKTIRMEILLAIKEIMNKSDESSPNIEVCTHYCFLDLKYNFHNYTEHLRSYRNHH